MGLVGAAAAPNPLAAGMAAAQTAVDTAKMAVAALMGKDPGTPPCIGAILMGSPTVLIGGIPLPPIENCARAFFMKLNGPLARALHSIIGKVLGKGRAANFFNALTCHFTGHPVDVASGACSRRKKSCACPVRFRFVCSAIRATPGSGQLRKPEASVWARRDGARDGLCLCRDHRRRSRPIRCRPHRATRIRAAIRRPHHARGGAIFYLEASRLARSGREWHTLLDMCAVVRPSPSTPKGPTILASAMIACCWG